MISVINTYRSLQSPTVCRNLVSRFSSVLSKENGKITILNEQLHSSFKKINDAITGQSRARIGGAILYPSLALVSGLSFIVVYTPFCVGTHHIAMRFAYQAGLQALQLGDVTVCPKANSELVEKIAAEELSRFHVNYRGDLILHSRSAKAFSLDNFKGMAIETKLEQNLMMNKLKIMADWMVLDPGLEISYFHIEEDMRKQLDVVLRARQLRFRSAVGMVLGTTILGKMFLGGIMFGFAPSMGLVAAGTGWIDIDVSGKTDKLWKSISGKNEFIDIIKPEYRDLYKGNNFSNIRLSLSTFGNIEFSSEEKLSFRKSGHFKVKKIDLFGDNV